MKKTVRILITVTLLLALALPVLAAAPQTDADTQASCSHTSYTTSYIYSYVFSDYTYHEVYRTERRTCKSCNSVFYTGNPEQLRLAAHSGTLTFIKGDHVGDYSNHVHIYGGYCTICNEWYEEHRKSGCTSYRCIDPMSLGPVVEIM